MSKILYVEDNFQNYRLVMRFLKAEQNGYEITQAEDGETALKMVPEFQPDLILMDINLPDIDGTEVTRRLKSNPAFKNIPIVALTANAMVGDRERFLADGCDEYLRKPISRTDLRTVLDRFLQAASEAEKSAKARPAVVKAAAKNGAKPPESQIEKAS